MNDSIRIERNRNRQELGLVAEVHMLEERTLLTSSFKLPASLVGQIAGQSGNLVMTSRAYADAQRMVDTAIKNFAKEVSNLNPSAANFAARVGLLGSGVYAPATLLGKLDRALQAVEAKFPFGRGISGATGGLGISTATAATSLNPSPSALQGVILGAVIPSSGTSVAGILDDGISNLGPAPAKAAIAGVIETVRQGTLQFRATGVVGPLLGTLPQYLASFGPSAGAGGFSVRNT